MKPKTPADSFEISLPSGGQRLRTYLQLMGAGSLTLSILLHAVGLLLFSMFVWSKAKPTPPEPYLFVSHGSVSNGPNNLQEKAQQKLHQSHTTARGCFCPIAVNLPDIPSPTTLGALNTFPSLGSTGLGVGNGLLGRGHEGKCGIGPDLQNGKLAPTFLHLPAVGNAIIFVIDTSGSMVTNCGPAGIAAIRRELEIAIMGLPGTSRFNLICFGQDADLFQPECVTASSAQKLAALEFFKFYYQGARTRTEKFGKAGKDSEGTNYLPVKAADVSGMEGTAGGSRMDLALAKAFSMQASTIFLLSDGEPGTSRDGKAIEKQDLLQFMVRTAHTAHAEKTIVNTIAVNEEARPFLKKIAQRFSGKFKQVHVE